MSWPALSKSDVLPYATDKIQANSTMCDTVDGRDPAPPKTFWNDDSLVNISKQWFSMVSYLVQDLVHRIACAVSANHWAWALRQSQVQSPALQRPALPTGQCPSSVMPKSVAMGKQHKILIEKLISYKHICGDFFRNMHAREWLPQAFQVFDLCEFALSILQVDTEYQPSC